MTPRPRLRRDRHRPVQPRPGLPHRPGRRPRRRSSSRPATRLRLAPRDDARRRHPAGAVPGRPGDDGRPDLALVASSATSRRPAGSTRSTSARPSTRCAASTTTTAAGPPTGWRTRLRFGQRGHRGRARRRGVRRAAPRTGETYRGRRLVLGIGTRPRVPAGLQEVLTAGGVHSADYLAAQGRAAARRLDHRRRQRAERGRGLPPTCSPRAPPSATPALGDPQPAVLPDGVHQAHPGDDLARSTPRYFQGLPAGDPRRGSGASSAALYKGISTDPIDEIFDLHYRLRVAGRRPAHHAAHQPPR